MKFEDNKIIDALKQYVKSNPVTLKLGDDVIPPKNLKFVVLSRPFQIGDYGEGYNGNIEGLCTLDYELGFGYKSDAKFSFNCIVNVETTNFEETVTKVKDNVIYIKKM